MQVQIMQWGCGGSDCFHIALLDSLPGEILMFVIAQINKLNTFYFPQNFHTGLCTKYN